MITEAGLSIAQAPDKVQRSDVRDDRLPANQQNEISQAGQGSDAGPAVVANFSAAALESSRAVAQTTQAADQNRPAPEQEVERQPPPEEPPRQSVDTYV